MKKRFKFILPLLPGLIAVALYLILPHFPAFTERVFSRGIFHVISVPLGGLVAVLPFSLTAVLAVLSPLILLALLALFIRRLVKSKGRRRRVGARALRACCWALSCGLLLYMVMHGANFYRLPLSELMNIDTSSCTAEELYAVCVDLADKASAERAALAEDGSGRMKLPVGMAEELRRADAGYRALEGQYPFLWGGVWRAKPVEPRIVSHYWSYTNITGMYFPFLAEANVNIDPPACTIPFTASHELGHTRGFAREDECNFLAFLTATHSPYAEYRYSGYLLAYQYCIGDLNKADGDLASRAAGHCSAAVNRDLQGQSDYWRQFATPVGETVSNAANQVNNAFIQSQGVPSGVYSYNEAVKLIVGYEQNP